MAKNTGPHHRKPTEADMARARTSRNVALVLVGTMALWLLGPWIGQALGLPGEYAFLFDLAAMAAFFWAMFVTVGLWRSRDRS